MCKHIYKCIFANKFSFSHVSSYFVSTNGIYYQKKCNVNICFLNKTICHIKISLRPFLKSNFWHFIKTYHKNSPITSVCNICDTSKSDALLLVCKWLAEIPWSLYWTGSKKPPKFTIDPPFSTWKLYSDVTAPFASVENLHFDTPCLQIAKKFRPNILTEIL